MPKQPQYQFRGIVIPADIVNDLDDGKITYAESRLLGLIDALVNSRGEGCFANNRYLAEHMGGVTKGYIQDLLRKLIAKGYVERTEDESGHRFLETCYSRISKFRDRQPADGGDRQPADPDNTSLHSSEKYLRKEMSDPVARRSAGESSMPRSSFFPHLDKQETKTTEIHHSWSVVLHEAVKNKRRRVQAWSRVSWAKKFAQLERELEGDSERIQRALFWYVDNAGQQGVPPIESAAAFVKYFNWLEDAMKKNTTLSPEQITPAAKRIIEKLCMKRWPKGSAAQLPNAVQTSLNNYNALLAKHKAFLASIKEEQDDDRARQIKRAERKGIKPVIRTSESHEVRFAKGITLPSAEHLIGIWFESANKEVHEWTAWSGDLKYYILKTDGERFLRLARDWAQKYWGDSRRWDLHMKELNKEQS